MSTGFARCICRHCDGPFEIPREYLGETRDCPHCQAATLLNEAPPPKAIQPPLKPGKTTNDRPRGTKPPTLFLGLIFIALPGIYLVLNGLYSKTETVFQQILAHIDGIGGMILIGLAMVIEAISRVARLIAEQRDRS